MRGLQKFKNRDFNYSHFPTDLAGGWFLGLGELKSEIIFKKLWKVVLEEANKTTIKTIQVQPMVGSTVQYHPALTPRESCMVLRKYQVCD